MRYDKKSGILTFGKNISKENLDRELRKFERSNEQYDWTWRWTPAEEKLSFLVWISKNLSVEDAKEIFDKLTR